MIHPQDWSLSSLSSRIRNGKKGYAMSPQDEKIYVTFLQPRGKIILDIGAYKGDSASLFLEHGAIKVISVEKNSEYFAQIPKDSRIESYCETASEKFLKRNDWQGCKIDIEGYELDLLPYLANEKRQVVLESHNWYINEKFREIGYEFLTAPDSMLGQCLMGKQVGIPEKNHLFQKIPN